MVTEFDEGLWGTLLDFMIVYNKKNIAVTFKDGAEEPLDQYSLRRRQLGNCHEIPASILGRYRNVTVLVVADAASLLPVS